MESRKNTEHFSEKTRYQNLESGLQDLVQVISFMSFLVGAGFLCYKLQATGLHYQNPGDWFLVFWMLIAGGNAVAMVTMTRYRRIWISIEREFGLDKLTGVVHRSNFEKMLDEELRRGGRYHYPVTLCYLDLDDFKSYNEHFGREAGDKLLRQFGQLLKGMTRFADCVARYQNDEFGVLLPHTDIVHAEKFIARLQRLMRERLDYGFSAGVTSYQSGENKAQFIMRALTALNQAKHEGKKRVRYIVGDSPATLSF